MHFNDSINKGRGVKSSPKEELDHLMKIKYVKTLEI
jgi:hypothetical protein